MRRLLLTLAMTVIAGPALAHGGGVPVRWSLEPGLLAPLLLSFALYGLGFWRLWRRSGPGKRVRARLGTLFFAGWLCLAAAVVSPLHALGERSFAAHMFEHELLMLVAAPLLVASRSVSTMIWAFPAGGRRVLGSAGRSGGVQALWRRLTEPWTATLLQAAALWLWHLPSLFDRALGGEAWHIAQHLSFLVSALLFWTAMFKRRVAGRALGAPVLCLFATSVVSGALGALMAFSLSPWYARYAQMGMAPFGLTPVEDQQVAGLLMWVPGGLVHIGAALLLIATALREPAARSLQHVSA